MLVKTINPLTKNRVKIILESGFTFVLYKGELSVYGIKEEKELSKESYDSIMNEVLPKRAKLRAMNLLKLKPYTVKGLTDKLRDGGYPEEIINIAIEYVSSFHYLNDYQYALDYIYTYKTRKNSMKLKQDLISKGVSKDLIDMAFEESFAEDEGDFEEEQIKAFAMKKGYYDRNFTYEETQKLTATLYRKGYSIDKIRKVLNTTGVDE